MTAKLFVGMIIVVCAGWLSHARAKAQAEPFAANLAIVVLTSPQTDGERIIEIQDAKFNPDQLTIKPHTKVRWVNHCNENRRIKADQVEFDSGDLAPGQAFSYIFDRQLVYNYYCAGHGDKSGRGMHGQIKVTPQSQ